MTDLTYEFAPIESIAQARESLIERGVDLTRPGQRTAGFFVGSVAMHKGMEVSQVDVDHWVVTQGLLRAFDDMVDDEGMYDISEPLLTVSQGNPVEGHIATPEAETFASLLGTYGPDRASAQIVNFNLWGVHAQKRAECTTVERYIDVVLEEALTYGALLGCIDRDVTDEQATNMAAVDEWIGGFLRAGYFIDHVADLRDDYIHGLVDVKPTLRNQFKLAKCIVRYGGVSAVTQLPIAAGKDLLTLVKRYGF